MEYKPIFPDRKYQGKESDFQKSAMILIRSFGSDIFAFHVKNEGIVSRGFQGIKYGGKKKAEGVVSGIPDILLIDYNGGMAIELKVGNNKPSKNQLECLEKFNERAWYTCVCWSLDDLEYHLKQYLSI